MSAIEEVLWNIFTFYSLNGNPKDPSRLHSMALLKLCKDIMALDQIMTESPITQADLHLIYTSVLRSPLKVCLAYCSLSMAKDHEILICDAV
jgi:hypothetical protein